MDIYRAVKLADELQVFVSDIDPSREMYAPTRVKLETISSRCVGIESTLSNLLERSTDLLSITDSSDAVGAMQQVSLFVNQFIHSGCNKRPDVLHNLATIGNLCYEIAKQVSQVHELSSQVDYTISATNDATQNLLETILSKVNQIESNTQPLKPIELDSSLDSDICIDVQSNIDSDISIETSPVYGPSNAPLRVPSRAECLPDFHKMFDEISLHDFGYSEVNSCAHMLSTWYKSRFEVESDTFRYSVSNISDWALGLVLHYGKCLENGTLDLFTKDFDSWISHLNDNKSYPVPYNTYKLCKNPKQDEITLTAFVLWDFLTLEVFEKYKVPPGCRYIYPQCSDMGNWVCGKHELEGPDEYECYINSPSIVQTVGFTKRIQHIMEDTDEIY